MDAILKIFNFYLKDNIADIKVEILDFYKSGEVLPAKVEDALNHVYLDINHDSIYLLYKRSVMELDFPEKLIINITIELYLFKVINSFDLITFLTGLNYQQIDELPSNYQDLITSLNVLKEDDADGFIKINDDDFLHKSIENFVN